MRVNIDDARRHKFAGTIDHRNIRWNRCSRSSNTFDLAAGHEDDAAIDLAAAPVIDGRSADRGGDVGEGPRGDGGAG